jgi:hypothetical protein
MTWRDLLIDAMNDTWSTLEGVRPRFPEMPTISWNEFCYDDMDKEYLCSKIAGPKPTLYEVAPELFSLMANPGLFQFPSKEDIASVAVGIDKEAYAQKWRQHNQFLL